MVIKLISVFGRQLNWNRKGSNKETDKNNPLIRVISLYFLLLNLWMLDNLKYDQTNKSISALDLWHFSFMSY